MKNKLKKLVHQQLFLPFLMLILVLLIGVVFGAVQGFLIGYLNIQPFIITMAGMFFARGMTAVISTDQLSITQDMNPTFYAWANARINLPAFMGYANADGTGSRLHLFYRRQTIAKAGARGP